MNSTYVFKGGYNRFGGEATICASSLTAAQFDMMALYLQDYEKDMITATGLDRTTLINEELQKGYWLNHTGEERSRIDGEPYAQWTIKPTF